MKRRSLRDAFAERSTVDANGCWLMSGHLTNGYAQIRDGEGKQRAAHRVAYETFVGPIPAGLHIDHLCRVRNCVNPAHLEAVPQRVNSLRGESFSAINAQKTHCVNGHEFTPENTYYRSPGHRQCRTCGNAAYRAYYRRKQQTPDPA